MMDCGRLVVAGRTKPPGLFGAVHTLMRTEKAAVTSTTAAVNQERFAIEVTELRKTYKEASTSALDGIDLTVSAGEVFGLIGPNGAGKTTLIGCLLGLLRPDSGSVLIFGKSPDCLSVRKTTGYLPERTDFEHWMTGRQFLEYHFGLSKRDRSHAAAEIVEALEFVELAESVWDRRLKTYSRGMLQRLNLAQVLIGRPRLMLLDEPTLGLDPTGVAVVRKLISKVRDSGVTAIINSHQLDEVERLCDNVAFIKQGKIASEHRMKADCLNDYVLFVRWHTNIFVNSMDSLVSSAAERTGARVCDQSREWARFLVKDSNKAAQLIKELVGCGLAVEEAVAERQRLEHLFLQTPAETETP